MSNPDVSIAICTRNRSDSLRETLKSIHTVNVPTGWSVEMLVVDNGSDDHTRSVVEASGFDKIALRYCLEPNVGLSYARNRALTELHGRALLLTDDDMRFPTNWLEGMCGNILNGSCDIVAGGVRIADHLVRPWFTKYHRNVLAETTKVEQTYPQWPFGGNMAFSNAVLDAVPRFDEELGAGRLGYSEDTLFACQLHDAGYRMSTALDVCVEHNFEPSRLLRSSFTDDAKKRGQSDAYLKRHWIHQEGRAFPHLRMVARIAQLAFYRLTHPSENNSHEGLSEHEARLHYLISFYRQSLIEDKRPRNYSRRGLVKLRRHPDCE